MQGIGSVLKEYRNKLGFSLAEVHSKIGITDSRLSRIERGEGKFPVPNELKSLAHLYGRQYDRVTYRRWLYQRG